MNLVIYTTLFGKFVLNSCPVRPETYHLSLPLFSPLQDFWYMAWEGQSSLIIMLTTIVERGRVKCHKYWPDVGEVMDFEGSDLRVTCTKEDEHESFAYRYVRKEREKAAED